MLSAIVQCINTANTFKIKYFILTWKFDKYNYNWTLGSQKHWENIIGKHDSEKNQFFLELLDMFFLFFFHFAKKKVRVAPIY